MATPIAKALTTALTPEQKKMRDNLGSKQYWERRWAEDSDGVCADLLALYTITGENTRQVIEDLIDKKLTHTEDSFVENGRKLLKEVQTIAGRQDALESRRKADRRETDRNTADIEQLKHQGMNAAIKLDHITINTQESPKRLNNIESLLYGLTEDALKSKHQPKKPAPKTVAIISAIPTMAWVPIIGAILFLITLYTGHLAEFTAFIESVKGKGVGK